MECWGNTLLSEREGGEVIGIKCDLCAKHLAGDDAAAEWESIWLEYKSNLSRVSRGQAAKYRSDARFVMKIIPDMPRDKAGRDARIRAALKLPPRGSWLTRHDVPQSEAGYLYLQAKLLAAGARGLPRETAINRWDKEEFAQPVQLRTEFLLDEKKAHTKAEVKEVPELWEQRTGTLMMRAWAAAFSCEVGLKSILMTRNDKVRKTHDLWDLYSDLPEDSQKRLKADYVAISDVLKKSRAIFGKWRYFENSASVKEAVKPVLRHYRVGELEKAARVIIDEGEMAGLEGNLVPRAHAAWTTELGEDPVITDFRETMRFEFETGESAFVWPNDGISSM